MSDWDIAKGEKIRTQGQRPESDDCAFISCIDLTPWQQEKLLEACISLLTVPLICTNKITGEVRYRSTHAVKINRSDSELYESVLEEEQIKVITSD